MKASNSSMNGRLSGQFINVGAVPLCPPVGWFGLGSSIRAFNFFTSFRTQYSEPYSPGGSLCHEITRWF